MRFVFLNLVCNKKKCLSVICGTVCYSLMLSGFCPVHFWAHLSQLSSVDAQRCEEGACAPLPTLAPLRGMRRDSGPKLYLTKISTQVCYTLASILCILKF